jgi:hypothetical protein
MGEVIRLRPRQGARSEVSVSAAADAVNKDGATILLFLGVRYERHQDDSSNPTKRQVRRGSRRKRA